MQSDSRIVAACQRTGPRSARPDTFQIFQCLTRERQKRFERFTTLDSEFSKDLNGGLCQREHMARGENRRRVVKGLGRSIHVQRMPTQDSCHVAGRAQRRSVTFYRKNFSVEVRNSYSAEGLQWVNRTDGGAHSLQLRQHTRTECATGMEYYFPPEHRFIE